MIALALAVSMLAKDPTPYSTERLAALAALERLPKNSKVEYGGGIVKCYGAYWYTEPATSNDSTRIELAVDVPMTWKGCEISAYYHSHTENNVVSNFFSGQDFVGAYIYHANSYIWSKYCECSWFLSKHVRMEDYLILDLGEGPSIVYQGTAL